jgi:hypothetical protein
MRPSSPEDGNSTRARLVAACECATMWSKQISLCASPAGMSHPAPGPLPVRDLCENVDGGTLNPCTGHLGAPWDMRLMMTARSTTATNANRAAM